MFNTFYIMTKKHIFHQIFYLRSIRGNKFIFTKFIAYLDTHGVIKELSVARTLQQNGVSKKKN